MRLKSVFVRSNTRLLSDGAIFILQRDQRQTQYFEGSQASQYVLLTLFLQNRKIANITTLQKAVFRCSDAHLLSDDTIFVSLHNQRQTRYFWGSHTFCRVLSSNKKHTDDYSACLFRYSSVSISPVLILNLCSSSKIAQRISAASSFCLESSSFSSSLYSLDILCFSSVIRTSLHILHNFALMYLM